MRNIDSIIDRLNNVKSIDESVVVKDTDIDYDKVNSIIGEDVEYQPLYHELPLHEQLMVDDFEDINEAKAVTFGKRAFPRDGWAIILSGGAGSGKGYTIKNQILIDAKVHDVDKLKELYSALNKRKGRKKFDFGNPDDVSELHALVSAKGWKKATWRNFFNDGGRGLKNVIFDTTGKNIHSMENITTMCKELGYKVALVWVVTNREVAMMRNLTRKRVVKQEIFHEIHNQVKKAVFPFLKSRIGSTVDEAWIIKSGEDRVKEVKREKGKRDASKVIKLKKVGSKFDIPKDLEDDIMAWLGDDEDMSPNTPNKYEDFDNVKNVLNKYREEKRDKDGNVEVDDDGNIKYNYKGYRELSFKKKGNEENRG